MTSEELKAHVNRPIKLYHGIDPTADTLHLGNLVGIIALTWFLKFGHEIYPVLGGATGRIGDPSGKSSERPLLNEQTLKQNVQRLEEFLQNILPGSKVLNNQTWLDHFSLIEFLRDVGKHFRVGPMLGKEMVRMRMQSEEGMSFTEFSYQLLQGYDFYYLHKTHGITLQIGGTDQWGNITAGIEFNRRMGEDPIYGLTYPLLTRSDGKKFGKSDEGAIWLSPDRLSPYQFYQYLYRVPDADVIRLLKMLTFLDMAEIHEIEKQMQSSDYVANSAQKRLAEEVTRFVHKEAGLETAIRVTKGVAPGSETRLSADVLKEIAADMPNATLSHKDVVGQKFVDVATRIGLTPSKSEALRLIKGGGAYFNNQKISDPAFSFDESHLIDGSYIVLSSGKKKKILVTVKK